MTPQCRTQFEHSAWTVLPGRRRWARGVEQRASIGPLLVVPDSFGWGATGNARGASGVEARHRLDVSFIS